MELGRKQTALQKYLGAAALEFSERHCPLLPMVCPSSFYMENLLVWENKTTPSKLWLSLSLLIWMLFLSGLNACNAFTVLLIREAKPGLC